MLGSIRLIDASQPTVYHVMSRTALDGLPFDDVANDQLLELIRDFSRLYFAEILGYCFTLLNSLRKNVLHVCAAK